MSLPSLEQRRDYFEQTREQTMSVFMGPQAYNDLPDAIRYVSMLDNAVIADFDGGTICLPEDAKNNDKLLVAPISFDEDCDVSPEFFQHTSRQVRAIGKSRSEELNANTPKEPVPTNVGDVTRAFVGSLGSIIPTDEQATKFLMVKRRPFLIMKMAVGERFSPAGLVAHELTHVKQQEDNPLTVISSQKSIDMAALRDELEAYHVGALIGRLNGVAKVDKKHAEDNEAFQEMQVAFDLMRIAFGVDPIDPYRPSPRLLRFMVQQLESVGCSKSNLLHAELNYEDLVGNLGSEESDD